MTSRATGYGVSNPRITLAPVPFEINRILVNNVDVNFRLGQIAWQIPTQTFRMYNGHGIWTNLGSAGGVLNTINNVAPFPANNIDLINQSGTGAVNIYGPGSGGAGTVGLEVNVDGVTIQRIGNQLVAVGIVPVLTLTGDNAVARTYALNNFTFEGGSGASNPGAGAIFFDSSAPGQMDVTVQVDDSTIEINASNQLQVVGSLSQTATSPAGLAPQFATFSIPAIYIVNSTSVSLQVLCVGRRQAAPNESAYLEYLSGYRVDGLGNVTVSPTDDYTTNGDLAVLPVMGLSSPGLNAVTFVISDQSGTGPIDWRANFSLTVIP